MEGSLTIGLLLSGSQQTLLRAGRTLLSCSRRLEQSLPQRHRDQSSGFRKRHDHSGSGSIWPGQRFLDPLLKNPYSDQYNLGFQRQWAPTRFSRSTTSARPTIASSSNSPAMRLSRQARAIRNCAPRSRTYSPRTDMYGVIGKSNYNSLQVSSGRTNHQWPYSQAGIHTIRRP